MSTSLPPHVASLVQQVLSQGDYASEEEVLLDAMTNLAQRHAPTHSAGIRSEGSERSELGARLRALRQQYIERGGQLLSSDEIERELANRRGERHPGN